MLAATAFVAGCGSDDGGSVSAAPKTDPDAETTAVKLVDAPGPAPDAAKIAKRCHLGAPQPGAKVRVVEGLLPDDAFALRTDDGRGRLVFRSTLREAYRAMLANAEKQGLTIERQELEGVDAELEIETGEGVLRFGFGPAGLCRNVSQATVILGRE